jgi:hypothetical protein
MWMIAMRYGDLLGRHPELGCHPERAPLGAPVEGRPSEVEARETPAVLSWTETIEWSRTGTELILRS